MKSIVFDNGWDTFYTAFCEIFPEGSTIRNSIPKTWDTNFFVYCEYFRAEDLSKKGELIEIQTKVMKNDEIKKAIKDFGKKVQTALSKK
jgi:hypothetical protein